MIVQRKWMYLESIFIGGDIRAQLPKEAKKFDKLDQQFKEVSAPGKCRTDYKSGGFYYWTFQYNIAISIIFV